MNARYISIALIGALSLSACSASKFSSKFDALSKASVFGVYTGHLDQPDPVGNGITQPGFNGGSSGGSINQPITGGGSSGNIGDIENCIKDPKACSNLLNQPDGNNSDVSLLLMCSDSRSDNAQNFKGALAKNLEIKLLLDNKICTSDPAAIKKIVEKKSFTIDDAKALCAGLVPQVGTWSNVSLVVGDNIQNSIRGNINLLYARNRSTQPVEEAADSLCDHRASPLVIHVGSNPLNPLPIALSSQDDGILFDLLGYMSSHSKVQISWFTNDEYAVLTLPDSHGQIHSIDQLFGNATIGPDGLSAENGYQALAKYDGTSKDGFFQLSPKDGKIDSSDAIYARLRLWSDKNKDGIAQPRELMSLQQGGIKSIDLVYSNDFAETDPYGNQTLMKSVVTRFNGDLDLIFDLWFAYKF